MHTNKYKKGEHMESNHKRTVWSSIDNHYQCSLNHNIYKTRKLKTKQVHRLKK